MGRTKDMRPIVIAIALVVITFAQPLTVAVVGVCGSDRPSAIEQACDPSSLTLDEGGAPGDAGGDPASAHALLAGVPAYGTVGGPADLTDWFYMDLLAGDEIRLSSNGVLFRMRTPDGVVRDLTTLTADIVDVTGRHFFITRAAAARYAVRLDVLPGVAQDDAGLGRDAGDTTAARDTLAEGVWTGTLTGPDTVDDFRLVTGLPVYTTLRFEVLEGDAAIDSFHTTNPDAWLQGPAPGEWTFSGGWEQEIRIVANVTPSRYQISVERLPYAALPTPLELTELPRVSEVAASGGSIYVGGWEGLHRFANGALVRVAAVNVMSMIGDAEGGLIYSTSDGTFRLGEPDPIAPFMVVDSFDTAGDLIGRGHDGLGRYGMRVQTEGRALREIDDFPGVWKPRVSAEGRVFAQNLTGGIVELDLETGQERGIFPLRTSGPVVIDAEGDLLLLDHLLDALWRVDPDTGAHEIVAGPFHGAWSIAPAPGGVYVIAPDSSFDGKALYHVALPTAGVQAIVRSYHPPPAADLQVAISQRSVEGAPGQDLRVVVVDVTNAGPTASGASVPLHVRDTVNLPPSAAPGSTFFVPPLLPGASMRFEVAWDATEDLGAHRWVAQVDPFVTLGEANRSNNEAMLETARLFDAP